MKVNCATQSFFLTTKPADLAYDPFVSISGVISTRLQNEPAPNYIKEIFYT